MWWSLAMWRRDGWLMAMEDELITDSPLDVAFTVGFEAGVLAAESTALAEYQRLQATWVALCCQILRAWTGILITINRKLRG